MEDQMQSQIAQLRQQLGGREITQENVQEYEQKQREIKQMQDEMLAQICTPEAAQRLNTVKLVKPQVAEKVQNQLLQMASSGMLKSRVDENRVKEMLEKAGGSAQDKAAKVTIQRKRNAMYEDESDDNDDDLR